MTLLLLASVLTMGSMLPEDLVFTVRSEDRNGAIELSTAMAIGPYCAVSLAVFPSGSPVSLETDEGIFQPDTVISSLDLGLHVLVFGEELFQSWQVPCEEAPEVGDRLTIIGQGLSGLLAIQGTACQRYPDGAILLSAPLLDGMMGAAVFDDRDRLIGVVTGVMDIESDPLDQSQEYLVLYPSQIWYMWAQLAASPDIYDVEPFGVTAMASISLTSDRPSGIQLVSVIEGGRAWSIGLRPGDLIIRIDGNCVFHPETLRGLRILSADTLEATVWSRGLEHIVLIPPAVQN